MKIPAAFKRWLTRLIREHIIDDDYRLWPPSPDGSQHKPTPRSPHDT